MEHQSCIQNQPHESSGLVESCHNYEWLKHTIVCHTVTRICYENSISACGLGWVWICQQWGNVPTVLATAAKNLAILFYYCFVKDIFWKNIAQQSCFSNSQEMKQVCKWYMGNEPMHFLVVFIYYWPLKVLFCQTKKQSIPFLSSEFCNLSFKCRVLFKPVKNTTTRF